MKFKIELGDITVYKVAAIVNAANTSLLGVGGVDGDIHRAAGHQLLEECKKIGGCKTGTAVITKGYNLKAAYVIHTAGPVFDGNLEKSSPLLASCYRQSLKLALKHNLKTIAFPSISAGAYRFPLKEAAKTALKTIKEFSDSDLEITMVCFSNDAKAAYEHAAKEKFK
ncbi:MAG: O-acetyl-ADP-ribose deacetylase [Endomicrobium sp.]|jgi:O-acetyl-ADP-ribose deacetylase (regulator of RNase III)|nr:O-acetyl-ADP-ribose deacetylase [Endomicrobium sp.]